MRPAERLSGLIRLLLSPGGQIAAWIGAAAFGVYGVIASLHDFARFPGWPANTDTSLYIRAADAVLAGVSPHSEQPILSDPYAYPPFLASFHALLELALGGGHGRSWMLWALVGEVALAAGIIQLMRGFGRKAPWSWTALAVAIALASHLSRIDFVHGQTNTLIFCLAVTGLRFHLAGRTLPGALIWGAAFAIKPFIGVMAFYLMRRGEWKAAFGCIASAAVFFVVPFLRWGADAPHIFMGWMNVSHFYTSLPAVAKSDNYSAYGFFHRIFGETEFATPWVQAPLLILPATALIAAAGITAVAFGVRGRRFAADPADTRAPLALLELGVVLGAALCAGPLFEGDYAFYLLPGLAGAVWLAMQRLRERSLDAAAMIWCAALWALPFVLVFMPVQMWFLRAPVWGRLEGAWQLLGARNGALFLIATLASGWTLWREHRNPTVTFATV
ncbi:MAG: glycosyltransferase family 87 protein [Alphaproteobacteria bacterium]